jgi:hypothetical protein
MALAEGKVGPFNAADGSMVNQRFGRSGEQIVADGHSHFQEAVQRGNVFTATTGTSGVAPGTALSTTPPFSLYNPAGSNVNLVVLEAEMLYISGTFGAGVVYYAVNNANGQAAPTGGTTLTPICNKIGSTALPQGKSFQGATLPATPSAFKPAFPVGGNPSGIVPAKDLVDGAIVVTPGNILSLQEVGAAGTSPLGGFSVTWEEVAQ